MHLLAGCAEEDAEENAGGEDPGQDHVHDVERVAAPDVDGEHDVGEPLLLAALEEELPPLHRGPHQLPLPVLLVVVQVDGVLVRAQVHLGGVIAPRTEHQVALLLVKRVVRDVYLAHGLENSARLPSYRPLRLDHTLELSEISINLLSSE